MEWQLVSWTMVVMSMSPVHGDIMIDGYSVALTPISGSLDLTRPDGLKVGLSFYELTETDMAGNPIQVPGHSVTEGDFSALNFTLTDACSKVVRYSDQVSARYFYYETMLPTISPTTRLATEVYFLTSGGHVSNHNELTPVRPNDVKLTFTVSGWDWCRACDQTDGQSVDGEYLKLAFELRLPSGGRLQDRGLNPSVPKVYDLGNSMKMSLSRKVNVDQNWRTMLDGYPSDTTENNQHLVHILIPRFRRMGMYDPVISLNTTDLEARDESDDLSAAPCSGSGSRPPLSAGVDPVRLAGSSWLSMLLSALTVWYSVLTERRCMI